MRPFQDFFSKIRNQVSIVAVIQATLQLKNKGKDYIGLCPFHSENTPSFTVNLEKRFYHCFGCSAHGDVIQFVASYEGIPYKEAATKIARRYGIEIPKNDSYEKKALEIHTEIQKSLEIAKSFFQSNLNSSTLSYLKQRGIEEELIRSFEIGYAPGQNRLIKHLEERKISLVTMEQAGLIGKTEQNKIYELFRNRIIFPINNSLGKTLGFGGRALGEATPKYLNSPETPLFKKSHVLFGENLAMNSAYKSNSMILVEGYLDVMSMHSIGLTNTVAALGTAVTNDHLTRLWQNVDEIVLCLDSDKAGINALKRIIDIGADHVSTKKQLSIVSLPLGTDPNEAITSGIDVKDLVKNKISLSEAVWHYNTMGSDFSSAEKKASLEKTLLEYTRRIKDPILKKNYDQNFREKLRQIGSRWNLGPKKNFPNHAEKNKTPDFIHKTEKENIEYCILASIIHSPQLIPKQEIVSELGELAFTNKDLESFLHWILERATETHFDLVKDIQGSNFTQMFSTIKEIYSQQVSHNIAPKALVMLCDRHKLEVLKSEYMQLLHAGDDKSMKRLEVYKGEIETLTEKIRSEME